MASETKHVNIIFKDEPRKGKNEGYIAVVDEDAHPGHPLPPEGPGKPPEGGDEHPAHPICLPGDECWGQDLHPGHPICLPGMPCWPDSPPDPGVPPDLPIVIPATLSSIPAGVTPPEAPSPDATVCIITVGPEAKMVGARRTAYCWINPVINPLPGDAKKAG